MADVEAGGADMQCHSLKLFSECNAREQARIEMSAYLEPANRKALLEALARDGINTLIVDYQGYTDGRRRILGATTTANVPVDIQNLNGGDLVQLALVGNELKLERHTASISQALSTYCDWIRQLRQVEAHHDDRPIERFIFDVARGTVRID